MKPVFLFAFVNDAVQSLNLSKEWTEAEKPLALDPDEGGLIFNLIPSAYFSDIWNKINRFHNRIAKFQYGSHSDGEGLDLRGASLNEESLANLLGLEEKLKLVFLNGCKNVYQVDALFEKRLCTQLS